MIRLSAAIRCGQLRRVRLSGFHSPSAPAYARLGNQEFNRAGTAASGRTEIMAPLWRRAPGLAGLALCLASTGAALAQPPRSNCATRRARRPRPCGRCRFSASRSRSRRGVKDRSRSTRPDSSSAPSRTRLPSCSRTHRFRRLFRDRRVASGAGDLAAQHPLHVQGSEGAECVYDNHLTKITAACFSRKAWYHQLERGGRCELSARSPTSVPTTSRVKARAQPTKIGGYMWSHRRHPNPLPVNEWNSAFQTGLHRVADSAPRSTFFSGPQNWPRW